MPDASQLPSLIRLFDDPSETIRTVVLGELAAWGDALQPALVSLESPPSAQTVSAVMTAVANQQAVSSAEQPTTTEAFEALTEGAVEPSAPFEIGQLVSHVRYGYRGIIVAVDEHCHAPKSWYLANRTRPSRDQPWYHVLVHDSSSVTYAAQTSLQADSSDDDIRHPLLPMFFDTVDPGRYLRNNKSWPPGADQGAG